MSSTPRCVQTLPLPLVPPPSLLLLPLLLLLLSFFLHPAVGTDVRLIVLRLFVLAVRWSLVRGRVCLRA